MEPGVFVSSVLRGQQKGAHANLLPVARRFERTGFRIVTNLKRSSRKKKRATTKQPQKAISGRKGATAKTQPATHKQAPSKKKSPAKSKPTPSMLSKGGGNATAAGVTFQATIGAIFGAQLLAERALDSRFGLGGAKPKSIRFVYNQAGQRSQAWRGGNDHGK